MESPTSSVTTLQFSCACREIVGFADISTSALPLLLSFCHCDTCRHVSGLLNISLVSLPVGAKICQTKGKPCCYKTSKAVSRYFCGNCGSSVYTDEETSQGLEIGICSGALEQREGLIEFGEHIHVADTKDGGLRDWMLNIPAWEGSSRQSKEIPKGQLFSVTPKLDSTPINERLHAHCACEGVQFDVTRPDRYSSECSLPWPDLIIPYHSNESTNEDDVKWWLRAGGTKYLAGTCACVSCRKKAGFDVQVFAFIPLANVQQLDGKPFDSETGTIQQYRSSPGVRRGFCRVCGANVFWHADGRAGMDLSVGLFDAPSGARAEEWLEWWTERVSFEELAANKVYISSLSKGLKHWATSRLAASRTAKEEGI